MTRCVHHWQQIEKNEPKLYGTSLVDLIDFVITPYIVSRNIVTRKLLCTRCAKMKTIVEPDPMSVLLKPAPQSNELGGK